MTEVTQDSRDLLVDICNDLLECACECVAVAKKKQSNVVQVIYVDQEGKDASVNVYDFYYHIWKSTDTLDRLASQFLKDANMAPIIAYYNGIANESAVKAGTKIKIPILQETQANIKNKIYAQPNMQDNYGKDIQINENGDFVVENGDFATTKNKDNLSQALLLRLTTASQKRIRLNCYGIRQSIGDSMALSSYLTSSIEQTIKADPRIKDIESLSFYGDGDKLYVKVIYIDINGNNGNFTGEV